MPQELEPTRIGQLRLASHRLVGARASDPADVVRRLGAVQAQDYQQSLWAVGARLPGASAADVQLAIEQARIVRSWPMRGTIHLVAPEDLRWLLALCTPRIVAGEAGRLRQLELTEADVGRAGELVGDALAAAAGPLLTRATLMATLQAGGLATTGQRGYHLLLRLALAGMICLGPVQAKQQTFALVDRWLPAGGSDDPNDREEALGRLAHRFAASHGPVTVHDLARWSGLTVADARAGLNAGWMPTGGPGLVTMTCEGTQYWLAETVASAPTPRGWHRPLLLAGFDEFLIGYKNRDTVVDPQFAQRIVPGNNGMFMPMLVQAGRVTGTWRRTLTAKQLAVTVTRFEPGSVSPGELAAAAETFRQFYAPAVRLNLEVI